MREPREALDAARKAAEAAPDPQVPGAPWSLEHTPVTKKQLVEWAIIEPDMSEVYSTRRLGRPVTAFKRLLIRLLYQYVGQISAQQSRFNAHVASRILHLEQRVRVLEESVSERPASPAGTASARRGHDESR
jgi:hypothetical protein